MLPEHLKKSFVDFHNTMVSNGILDPKTEAITVLSRPCSQQPQLMGLIVPMNPQSGFDRSYNPTP